MISGLTVTVDALEDVREYIERVPTMSTLAARLAINQVAQREGLALIRDKINSEVMFPAGYLTEQTSDGKRRLDVKSFAQDDKLEATIAARARPTSLARFANSGLATWHRGMKVRVSVSRERPNDGDSDRYFFLRLRTGKSISEDNYNVGLAIRLRPGETFHNKKYITAQPFDVSPNGSGVYLLYGPSVHQVFKGVADDLVPQIATMVKDEFLRQFVRLSSGDRNG